MLVLESRSFAHKWSNSAKRGLSSGVLGGNSSKTEFAIGRSLHLPSHTISGDSN